MNELINKAIENVPKVYESGRKIGHDEGYDNGLSVAIDAQEEFLADKPQTHYDIFWDAYQYNGTKKGYNYTFAGSGWNDETFKPKYDIIPTSTYHMFSQTSITDLVAALERANITFDMSKDITSQYFIQDSSYLTRLPVLDLRGKSNINYFIYNATALQRIDKIILKDNGSQKFNNYSFNNIPKLEHIIFEGVIGQNNFDIHWSTLLDKESIESIINCLSTTTSGLTVTLSQTAIDNAFTSEEWEVLEATKPNWTISLV